MMVTNGGVIIRIFRMPGIHNMCRGEHRKSQLLFIIDGIFINASLVLTMGVFLSGYFVYLKASDFLVGLLNNSINWAPIAAIFSYLIFERMEKRKKLLIALVSISRILVCSIVFLPLISKNNALVLYMAVIMTVAGNILWGVYSLGFTVWLFNILPRESRREYIYIRIFWLRISFTAATIVMGFVLDWFHKSYTGFLLVFGISLLLALIDVIILINADEPVNSVNKEAGFNPVMFLEPLKNSEYRGFLTFVLLYYVSLNISSSFTPLYLIRYLQFDYGFISIVNVIANIFLILCTKVWGWVERKRSLKFVFGLTAFFMVTEFFIYSFLKRDTYFLLFFAPIFAGIGNSGFNVAIFNYRYELMPETSRTIYEGWFGAVFGISTLISPAIGSAIMRRLPVIQNAVYQHSSFQLLYLISFILATGVILFAFYGPAKIRLVNDASTICG